eukprot:g27655.t1
MLGGMFSGHTQSGGEIFEKNGKKYKLFYGMSSDTAMRKHDGDLTITPFDIQWCYHRCDSPTINTLRVTLDLNVNQTCHINTGYQSRASEGKTVEVEFKGDVQETIQDILGGVRSTCTYVGAAKLKELSRRTTFIRVTQQLNPTF